MIKAWLLSVFAGETKSMVAELRKIVDELGTQNTSLKEENCRLMALARLLRDVNRDLDIKLSRGEVQ